jgi:uncharacterized protein
MKNAACWFLLTALVGGGVVAAEPQDNTQDSDTDITPVAEQFVQRLASGDFSAAADGFDATMKSALPAEKLKQTWESLVAQAGPFKTRLSTRTQRLGKYDVALVTCQFDKAKLDVKVVFNRQQQISGLFFVPAKSIAEYQRPPYVKPAALQEREVQVGTGEWALPGTLTMPVGDGPWPAVVLVHGSGPNDRDETIGPNKPFRDLAGGLASRGIAVLRYEKRTKHHAARLAALTDSLTVKEETIDDALAAVSLLRNTERIAPSKVFLLGHSLGGTLVPRIAALDAKIAAFIVLAGATRPLEDMIHDQFKHIFSLEGAVSEANKVKLRQLELQVARAKDPGLSPSTPSAELPLGIPAKYWLDLRGYRPQEVARGMKRNILILQGGRDYQVTAEDFQGW